MKYLPFFILLIIINSCKTENTETPIKSTTYSGTRHHVYKEHNCASTVPSEPWNCQSWSTTITTNELDTNQVEFFDNGDGTFTIEDKFDGYANHTFTLDSNKYYKGFDITIPPEVGHSVSGTYIVSFSSTNADTLFIDISENSSGNTSAAVKTVEYTLIKE